ncbi:MAG: MMPL family transporter [Deltaproteobacteria bacterium]
MAAQGGSMTARGYVAWLTKHARKIMISSVSLVGVSIYLVAFHLPVYADLSDLLPSDVPAIRDLRRLEARLAAKDTMVAVVVAPTTGERAAVAGSLAKRVREIEPRLVARVEDDDAVTRAFVKAHAGLYVPLADLQHTEHALAQKIAAAKLHANPLYIELDDKPADTHELDDLKKKRADADAKLAHSRYISDDGRSQVLVIETGFRATDTAADRALQDELDRFSRELRTAHPMVVIAFAGGVTQTLAEHDSLVQGMLVSSLATAALVALVLFLHLRSLRVLALLTTNIVAAAIVSFGLASLTVGHLNAATAFLGAIIAGNGVNYGILLVARYLEERRDLDPEAAMADAIAGTIRPTLIASLGAAIAYGALAVTHFKGFGDFALIGGLGMLVCWIASFVVLPVLVLRFAAGARATESPVFGRIAVGLFGVRRPAVACAFGVVLAVASIAITVRYVAHDPFEYDMTKLRSDAPDALATRHWMQYVNDTFGRGLAGMARSTFIAVDDREQVPAVVAALEAAHARDPMVGTVQSIDDAVPPNQAAKLAVLAKIRSELDDALDDLSDQDRAELAKLRPADDLHAFTAADLPSELRVKLEERDGRIGYLVSVTPGPAFDEWNGRDLVRFSAAIRQLPLPGGKTVTTSGPSVIFADIITAIRKDGVVVTVVAAVGLVMMVLLLVGRTRRAAAVLAGTAVGSLAMIAVCALVGLKINFLDFVALPIALGLGIDYAINVAHRAERADPGIALRSTGGTVLVCSLTTMIGYASLLVSNNLAIRGFGLASLIGEITCVVTALALVPAMIAVGAREVRSPGWQDGSRSAA